MEIEAVLQSLVTQPDQGPPGIYGPALGFENFEDAGPFDAETEITFRSSLGLAGLIDLNEEKPFLLPERVVDLQGRFNFPERLEHTLSIIVNGGFIAVEGGSCLGAGGASLVDGLGQR